MDLQETSARLLVVGGRLCFWLPDFTEDEGAAIGEITHEGSSEQASEAGTDSQAQVGPTCIAFISCLFPAVFVSETL